jgi:hypothetical protein
MAAESISNQRGKKDKQSGRTESSRKSEAVRNDIRGSIGQAAENVSDYVSEGAQEVRHRLRETTRDHEGTAVFVALAVGFGIGVALGTMLAPDRRRRTWRDRIATEGLGRRILESLENVVPEGLAERLGR